MRFTKMEGAGNDYVYVDLFQETVPDPAAAARILSDRRFGVGGDGLVLIGPSTRADVRMRIFNADGSEAQMCGNGVRCVAKYVRDRGRVVGDVVTVETAAGVLSVRVGFGPDGKVSSGEVEMGRPRLARREIPVLGDGDRAIDEPVEVAGRALRFTAVSMGNPHAVVFVE
ncbi:MAG: diaminopimelate epimerase, partial [Planctomycetes bacterium]|nr:diaminopimelate epimerase [Planctomycetota bacterium]